MNYIRDTRGKVGILALDLDDTLLREDLTISERNRAAVREAVDAGVTVVPASGRVPESMIRYARELGLTGTEGYMIGGNGTILVRTDTGQEILRQTLPVTEMLEIFRHVVSRNFPVQVYRDAGAFVNRDDPWAEVDAKLTGLGKTIVPEFEEFLVEARPVKLLIPGDPERILELQRELNGTYREVFNIFTSKPYFLEVLPRDSHKGAALRHLANMLGIPREEVMAVGDSMNDIEMLEYAGLGVAVANAIPYIKQHTDIVVEETNEQDAVAEIIYRYVLRPGDRYTRRDPALQR